MAYELYLNDPQMQTADETVICGLRWSASDQYRLVSVVGGVSCVGGDFSQTLHVHLSSMDASKHVLKTAEYNLYVTVM